ncbi:hypothetical protein PUN28_004732 [Cardiocondyla obscurior]|uniref:Uncharacterized protein n=1 Tax=Cardiocondyla obscurior TaxID=286306 RepID=A0AAW2GCC7_9HYME
MLASFDNKHSEMETGTEYTRANGVRTHEGNGANGKRRASERFARRKKESAIGGQKQRDRGNADYYVALSSGESTPFYFLRSRRRCMRDAFLDSPGWRCLKRGFSRRDTRT